jgi:filamentous hemagglutinin family protein
MKKDQAGWNWVHFWVALLSFLLIAPPYLFAMPQGAQVQSGQARISQPDLNNMHITQGTNKAIINWQSFSIGRPEAVRFFQPSSSSIALNRVVGGNPSEIYGLLSANGRIYLINTNGIMVGPTGQINVNSFIASTLGISNEDFLQGNNVFTQSVGKSLASIVNQGAITAADGGFVSLIAPSVQNQGTITANLGKVFIGGGERVTLNFDGENLISFAIEEEVKGVVLDQEGNPAEAIINNQGTISADGGEVILSAKSAIDSIKSVVNNDGVIAAKSLVNENGVIKLMGGDEGVVANSGTLDASGKVAGAKGGTVQVLGDKVGLFGDGLIDVSGDAGGGTVLVGGDFQGKNPSIMNASRTYVSPEFSIKADALTNGDGGRVIVWSDEVTRFYGDISARGGALGGDGGRSPNHPY